LEEVQVLQPAFGAVDQCAIVGVALADIELAADDVIARADVAADVDALDVGARALFHDEGEVDRVGLGVAVAARANIGEGVAAARGLDGHRLDALLHQVGVVDAARAELDLAAHDGRIDRAHVRDDVDLADLVLRALVDGEGDDEALLGRVVLTDRREDSHVGVAVLEVEAAQEVAVGLDAVRIVDVGGLQEAQPVADRGLDHAPEPARRISVRADEADVLHAGLLAFADVEDEVHAVVRQFDDLRRDGDVEAAAAVIDFDDALDVGLHGRLRQRAARLRLHFGLELIVLGLLVALEGDLIDDRVFRHDDDDAAAGVVDVHVGKQAGGVEAFQALVDLGRAEPAARAGVEIRPDGAGLDAAVALDLDRVRGLRGGNGGPGDGQGAATDKDAAEEYASERKSPNKPHTKSHALRALLSLRPPPIADSAGVRAGFRALYRVLPALQTKVPVQLPLSPQKVAGRQRLRGGEV